MGPKHKTDRARSLFGLPLPSPGTKFVLALGSLYLSLGAGLAWLAIRGLRSSADGLPIGSLAVGALCGLLLAIGVRVILQRHRIIGEAAHRRGIEALRARRFAESREHFTRAKILISEDWEPHYHLGLLEAQEKQSAAQALAHFKAGLLLAPDEPTLLFAMASIEDDLGKREQAQARLRALLATHPEHADAHCLLGCLQEQAGDPERAVLHYRQALDVNPDHPTALQNVTRLAQQESAPPLSRVAGINS